MMSSRQAMSTPLQHERQVFSDIRQLIEESRQQVALAVNASMSLLYWEIGRRVNELALNDQRAEYGSQVVRYLSARLVEEYGKSFSEKNLRRMIQFANVFPEKEIVVSLIRQLSWTHIIAVIPIEDPLKREFYIEMCKLEKWSVRVFRERINSMLYERTAISRKPEETISKELKKLREEEQLSPDLVFRDPYFLDFLGLKDTYSEKDLESAILSELQRFITELGTDFAFLSRQRRISIDNRDYYIDLLFYHRRLKRLVAIDLKLGEFEAAFKGQMELYLRYLAKHDMVEGENSPIGLILCTGKNSEHIELLELDRSDIRVSEYMTELPPKKLLEEKLHHILLQERERIGSKEYP
jgi:predicted nuclease of restriction endonuclease-like (RecB) superfamily